MANTTQSMTGATTGRPFARPGRFQQGLFNNRRRDNLTQARQPIHKGERIRCRILAASVPRHSHSLLETWVLDTHKVTGGWDLREDERYWG